MESVNNFKYRWIALIIQEQRTSISRWDRENKIITKTNNYFMFHWRLYNSRYNYFISSKSGYRSLKVCANGLENFCNTNNLSFSICSYENYQSLTNMDIGNFEYLTMKSALRDIQIRKKNGEKQMKKINKLALEKSSSHNFIL